MRFSCDNTLMKWNMFIAVISILNAAVTVYITVRGLSKATAIVGFTLSFLIIQGIHILMKKSKMVYFEMNEGCIVIERSDGRFDIPWSKIKNAVIGKKEIIITLDQGNINISDKKRIDNYKLFESLLLNKLGNRVLNN